MIRKFKALMAAALIAAVVVPFIPATSQAGSAAQANYWHRHDDKGW
jgi:hypothetical protein